MKREDKLAILLPANFKLTAWVENSMRHSCIASDLSPLYIISQSAWDELDTFTDNYPVECFMGLASAVIKADLEGLQAYIVVDNDPIKIGSKGKALKINDFKNHKIIHSRKLGSLLTCMHRRINTDPFETVKINIKDLRESEIINANECNVWLNLLIQQGLIRSEEFETMHRAFQNMIGSHQINPYEHEFSLTPFAWQTIEEQNRGKDSRNVFIAMSFGIEDKSKVREAIISACKEHGFNASTVDQENYLGKITDRIYAMIKESAFIVSDYCSNNHGVYFESGYAEGLGKKVIYTVRAGKDLEELHFDTKQTNYIIWSSYEELKEKISDRIRATIL